MDNESINMYQNFFTQLPNGIDLRNDSIREEDHCEETKIRVEEN
ncbi:hypothetical protein P4V41_07535 [Fictibacillus nanhaiensis]|nr:hypothetical protein [Fictibacillus nanhaiensis]